MRRRIFAALILAASAAFFMPAQAQTVALTPTPVQHFVDSNGIALSGGKLFTYAAGTTSKISTYTDSTGLTPNTNPIILNSRGEANVWLASAAYKFVLSPSTDSDPPTNPIWTVDNISAGGASAAVVSGNTALNALPHTFSQSVIRQAFNAGYPTLPLTFTSSATPCSLNSGAGDGGSQVPSSDGGCWLAAFPNGHVDIRYFGAIPDNTTPADAATIATIAYTTTALACTYIPSIAPGFTFQHEIDGGGGHGSFCIEGDHPSGAPYAALQVGTSIAMHFPNNTVGIHVKNTTNDWTVRNLSMSGNALTSSSPTNTIGLWIDNIFEGQVSNVYIQNFVTCRTVTAQGNKIAIYGVVCNDQNIYPNIVNGYPYACESLLGTGSGTAAAVVSDKDGVCREASWTATVNVDGDGSKTWFDITQNANGPPLWRADGVKVRVGASAFLPNGQTVLNGPLQACGVAGQSAAFDYSIFDISAAGGGGSGGTQLFCTIANATVTAGNPQIVVPSTTSYVAGTNILAESDHGLPLADKVVSIDDSTHLTLSAAPYVTGSVKIRFTQLAIATGGSPNFSQVCQATLSCGHQVEVRFGTAPGNAVGVHLQWLDPTGYAALDAEAVSDYVEFSPMHVGGYSYAMKHSGLNDGGITFKPLYFELINYLASIEGATYGDVVVAHRIINPPLVYNNYVDPIAGPTTICYNNYCQNYNGSNNGGYTNFPTVTIGTPGPAFVFTDFGEESLAGPFSFLMLECHGLQLASSDNVIVRFMQGNPPTPVSSSSYKYAGQYQSSASGTPTPWNSNGDTGIWVAANPMTSTFSLDFSLKFGGPINTSIMHQVSGYGTETSTTEERTLLIGGGLTANSNAITGVEVTTSTGVNFAASSTCSLSGHY